MLRISNNETFDITFCFLHIPRSMLSDSVIQRMLRAGTAGYVINSVDIKFLVLVGGVMFILKFVKPINPSAGADKPSDTPMSHPKLTLAHDIPVCGFSENCA